MTPNAQRRVVQVFRLTLYALPTNADPIRSMRAVLKTLLRKYGLRCVHIETETRNAGGKDDRRGKEA
jgi:hypothetical protein